MPLLVVALVALGSFIGLAGGVTGDVQAIGGGQPMGVGGAYYPPIREESQAYTIHAGFASQSTQVQMMVQDHLQVYLEDTCPGAQRASKKAMCAKYGVSTTST